MSITQKSAKEIVRDIAVYEKEMLKSFKGDTYSNEYFIFLKNIFSNLTLEKTSPRNYRLNTFEKANESLFVKNSKEHLYFTTNYLLELSNTIEVEGLTSAYSKAHTLFNHTYIQT